MWPEIPSPACQTILSAAKEGTGAEDIEGVEVVARPALAASVTDVLEADGYLLGTPANLGYMSGALKHFFEVYGVRIAPQPLESVELTRFVAEHVDNDIYQVDQNPA